MAKGLRDLIAWKTRYRPRVDIFDMGAGVYEARVSLDGTAIENRTKLEQDLREILPSGYSLKMTWT